MTHSIVAVGFKRDIGFLEYALMSVREFVTGYNEVVLAVPIQEEQEFKTFPERFSDIKLRMYYYWEDRGRGFIQHELMKCCADMLCPQADIITHLDCDSLFCKPVKLSEDVLHDGKIVILCAKYANLIKKQIPSQIWQPSTCKALGIQIDYEYMMAFPATYWARTYRDLRTCVEANHGVSFADYVMAQQNEFPQGFSEHNCLGAAAATFHPTGYQFAEIHADPEGIPDVSWDIRSKCDGLLRQLWSRGGIDNKVHDPNRGDTAKTYRQVCEDILAGKTQFINEGRQPLPTIQ